MKDNILFFIDMKMFHFGIADFIQKNSDHQLFAIIDGYNPLEKFFKNQQIVKFKDTFFARKYFHYAKDTQDNVFLQKIEDDYKIKLWDLVLRARYIYGYNDYHKFTHNEILSLLSNACKFYHNIINIVKPKYLLMRVTDSFQSELIYAMCKGKGIKILILSHMRLKNRAAICSDFDDISNFHTISRNNSDYIHRSKEELLDYYEKNSLYRPIKAFGAISREGSFRQHTKRRILNFFRKDQNFKNFYPNFGKSVFTIFFKNFLKAKYRQHFLDKNSINTILDEKFIFFPLQHEPERSLMISAPYHTNQLEVIHQIAKSLPIGYWLYVKEHPSQILRKWRPISYYKKLLGLPNVKLVHPMADQKELIKKCSLLITITGSAALEAAFYDKPSIIFSDVSFSMLPSIKKIEKYSELKNSLIEMINTNVNFDKLNDYVNFIEYNSFQFGIGDFRVVYSNYFLDELNYNKPFPELKVKSFLIKYNSYFELAGREYLKIINN